MALFQSGLNYYNFYGNTRLYIPKNTGTRSRFILAAVPE